MKRTRINPVSDKRKTRLKIYYHVRNEYLTDRTKCEVCNKRNSMDIHHIAGRLGDKLNDKTNFLAVCRPCHNWIHENGKAAREQGYLK